MITVFICYTIDPHKSAEFETYAKMLLPIIPRLGGDLVGYFLPHEGTNNIGFGLVRFGSLSEYEAYRARLKSDDETQAAFAYARRERCILHESRTFLRQATVG